ncbi:cytochrome P450 [Halocynthiibacter namhaensis]|uniref:cytochrome P450 n=1 Tax=Halocynthiibacter namhaensis TaxID=1290553 RepID=UPI00057923B3|nr:cytochrome P450 [Halocynthiibacter namhaensis]
MQKFTQSATDPDFVQNPYPLYTRMRAAGDLVFWSDYDLICATSHKAVSTLLRDRRFGREVPADKRKPIPDHLAPFYAVEAHSMLELERPRHPRLRGLVMRAFTSRRIKELAPEIEALTHQLIDEFPRGGFDLLTAFAQKIPVVIICRLLGVPETMWRELLEWSNAMVMMYQAGRTREMEDKAVRATEEFVAFMKGYVDERRTTPADDLISALISAEESGEKLSTDELITTCILLLNAGHEATVHSIGNAVKTILERDTKVNFTPEGIEKLTEETLRIDPPLHMFTRWCYEEVEICGHVFQPGDEVALLLASANRDDNTWADGDRFDPTREILTNTSFGAGAHFCIGAPLARMELQIALPILFERCPNLALATQPNYADIYHFHGLKALPVTAT